MSTLRVRFKLNPGRHGIALAKLSKQTENIEMFLRSLASDLGVQEARELWIADKFGNGSVMNRAELQAVVEVEKAHEWNVCISALVSAKGNLSKAKLPYAISPSTLERFARLADALDPDEPLGIAIYDVDTGRAKPFRNVGKLELEAIGRAIETESRYIGAVMGRLYEWTPGAEKPYLYIRELNSSELVKCTYSDDDYEKVARLFQRKTAIVIIEGRITLNLITKKTEVTHATGFNFAPELSDDDYEKFFGAAPGITGNLTSEEYIRNARRDRH
jgi:hypothetical protein